MLTIKKILCPTDFSEPSYEGLKYAIELARCFESELSLLHVVPVVPATPSTPNFRLDALEYERALHLAAGEKLNELIKQQVPKEVNARALLGQGDLGDESGQIAVDGGADRLERLARRETASEIVRIAEDDGTDLIVIATHGLTGWRHLVFGSVAEKVVRLAACPVLTIRMPRE
ncbi:MAG: universal stress protein [Acidobacteria bacterium]|nr:universal stress protein [Acidobacteriota bacterium]